MKRRAKDVIRISSLTLPCNASVFNELTVPQGFTYHMGKVGHGAAHLIHCSGIETSC